jgi:hypothetical protein
MSATFPMFVSFLSIPKARLDIYVSTVKHQSDNQISDLLGFGFAPASDNDDSRKPAQALFPARLQAGERTPNRYRFPLGFGIGLVVCRTAHKPDSLGAEQARPEAPAGRFEGGFS